MNPFQEEKEGNDGNNPFETKETPSKDTEIQQPVTPKRGSSKKFRNDTNNNDKEDEQQPKAPKRRSIKHHLRRTMTTSALLKPRPSSVLEDKRNAVKPPVDISLTETEEGTEGVKEKHFIGKSKTPTLERKNITEAPSDKPSLAYSPSKRSKFLRGISTTNLKKNTIERKKSKRQPPLQVSQVVPSAPPNETQVDSNEPDYSGIVKEIRKSKKIREPDSAPRVNFAIEFGKADIDTREYSHDMIIQEIESGFFLGPVLRAVYEGNDHEKFLERLDCRIKQHDRDIEKMCNFHYQGFIESITELINVRSDAEKLKAQTLSINRELQESGKEIARKSDDLIQCQIQQCNVASAIEKLSACLPVLQMYSKMCDQMKAGRYYSALKTLEQLEHTYLPRIYTYRFCEVMRENIPKVREQIKEISMSKLKDFLENVRKNSAKIGMVAMKQVEKERNLEQSVVEPIKINGYKNKSEEKPLKETNSKPTKPKNPPKQTKTKKKAPKIPQTISPQHQPRTNPFDDVTDEETSPPIDARNPFDDPNPFLNEHNGALTNNTVEELNPFAEEAVEPTTNSHDVNPFLYTNGEKEYETSESNSIKAEDYENLSASDLVDFSPVYKCLHIFGLVGSRTQFETYYRQQRRNQARLALEPPATMQDDPELYAHFFHEIVGFFVVEDHILHTAQNLISRQFMDDLWEMTISKLTAVLRSDSGYSSDAVVMMKVKNLIVIFADTLKAYGFSVGRLFGLLMEMRDQYGEILLKRWAQKFKDIFDEDNYTPMLIESDMESQALLSSFPYEDPNYEISVYPRKLPFSRFVPRIYNEMKNFILACLEYCEDLHLSSTEVDDMIRKSTNLLLTRTLASGLKTLVQKPSLGLTELVQIIVNTTHLENSCRHVEDFVHSITGVRVGSAHTAKLVGVSTFKDARNHTEEQIYNKLNSKIDEFFELAEYVWQLKEPLGMASRYLKDLIAFLQHNFEVFTNLPSNVAQTACMSACRHISTSLMELIMDPSVKVITMAALQQFNLDVIQCESFSNSEPVPGFQDGALQMSFVELRQLLDLFLSWDWSSYLADYGNGSSKYLRVNPGTALTLLEKIKEERGHRYIFTSLSKQEREKKRLLETVIKQLRAIVNAP